MPNHFHLVLRPVGDGDLSCWMHWLFTTHVRRYLKYYGHTGHVWQGRLKAFPIQEDGHLMAVVRYVELNPLRAGLVERAEDWSWSSLSSWKAGSTCGPRLQEDELLRKGNWCEYVNNPLTQSESDAIELSIRRDRPFGSDHWTRDTADWLGLESSLRSQGSQKGKKRNYLVHPKRVGQ